MAHQIEVNQDGTARTFYAGQVPWHGLGTAVEKEVTSEAAIRLAGLDWTVEKRPVYLRGTAAVDGIPVVGQEVPNYFATVRTEDEAILGVVGQSYEIIQNQEAFAFLDSLVGEGLAMYNCAGSLYGGKRIWITCKLPQAMQIGPDQVDKYLVCCTGHDGRLSLHIKWTPIRVVCQNTLSAAFGMRNGKVQAAGRDTVSVMHYRNWKEQAAQAREVLELTGVYYSRLEEVFQRLIKTPVTASDAQAFAERLYVPPKDDHGDPKTASTWLENRRAELVRLFRSGVGNDEPGVRGTRWALYSAVTEQQDHHRTFTASGNYGASDARMNSLLWGTAANVKKRALELLSA